jgi:hypothetical protein
VRCRQTAPALSISKASARVLGQIPGGQGPVICKRVKFFEIKIHPVIGLAGA